VAEIFHLCLGQRLDEKMRSMVVSGDIGEEDEAVLDGFVDVTVSSTI
jgi:hypothetical protein